MGTSPLLMQGRVFLHDVEGGVWGTGPVVDLDLVEALRRAPVDEINDLDAAIALAELLHRELEAYGTSGSEMLDEDGAALSIRALSSVLGRLSVEFALPFRNLSTFKQHWKRQGCEGSWQARRDLLHDLFEPLHAQLVRLDDAAMQALAEPVSTWGRTGWPMVDDEIRELRRRFRSATSPQDYRAVGTHCVGVLEAIGRTVYEPVPGEPVIPPDKTKLRLGRHIDRQLPGSANEEVRGLVNKSIELAHRVKHSQTPTRRDAGIAADAVIMLANILRRLSEPA
jgi:hypothetical protein